MEARDVFFLAGPKAEDVLGKQRKEGEGEGEEEEGGSGGRGEKHEAQAQAQAQAQALPEAREREQAVYRVLRQGVRGLRELRAWQETVLSQAAGGGKEPERQAGRMKQAEAREARPREKKRRRSRRLAAEKDEDGEKEKQQQQQQQKKEAVDAEKERRDEFAAAKEAVAQDRLAARVLQRRVRRAESLCLVRGVVAGSALGMGTQPQPQQQQQQQVNVYLEARKRCVLTFCQALDDALGGGGVRRGALTELVGMPATGKTQLCMQLALNVQIPRAFTTPACDMQSDSVNDMLQTHEALFVDTECSFRIDRAQEMAAALVQHLQRVASTQLKRAQRRHQQQQQQPQQSQQPRQHQAVETEVAHDVAAANMVADMAERLSTEHFLAGIHVVRAPSVDALETTVLALPELLKERPRVRLVVVDSVAFPFRGTSSGDSRQRTERLVAIAVQLQRVALARNAAVVVTNHVSSRSAGAGGSGSGIGIGIGTASGTASASADGWENTRLAPMLGDTWASLVTCRVLLTGPPPQQDPVGSGGQAVHRSATIVKCPFAHRSTVSFQIDRSGVRGCPPRPAPTPAAPLPPAPQPLPAVPSQL